MIKQSTANNILRTFFAQSTSVSVLSNKCYIALSTTTPDTDGSNFTEPTIGSTTGYQRALLGIYNQSATYIMGTPSNGSITNSKTIFFPKAETSWGTITYFGLFSDETDGTPVFWGELNEPVEVLASYVPIFTPGEFTISLA